MKKQYKAANGSVAITSDKDAQKVGERFEYLLEKNGTITPKLVLEDGKKVSSPLHKYFQWNNEIAAERYRLRVAGELLRSVVEVVIVGKDPQTHRSFYNVCSKEGKSVYVTLETAITDADYVKQIIMEAQSHIKSLSRTLDLFMLHYKKK